MNTFLWVSTCERKRNTYVLLHHVVKTDFGSAEGHLRSLVIHKAAKRRSKLASPSTLIHLAAIRGAIARVSLLRDWRGR